MAELSASFPAAVDAVRQKVPPDPLQARDRQAVDRTAEDFEAFFLSSMLEHMFAGVRTDGPFGGGQAETVYRSLMMQEYGKVIAKAGGVGIADMVKRELIRAQEGQ